MSREDEKLEISKTLNESWMDIVLHFKIMSLSGSLPEILIELSTFNTYRFSWEPLENYFVDTLYM